MKVRVNYSKCESVYFISWSDWYFGPFKVRFILRFKNWAGCTATVKHKVGLWAFVPSWLQGRAWSSGVNVAAQSTDPALAWQQVREPCFTIQSRPSLYLASTCVQALDVETPNVTTCCVVKNRLDHVADICTTISPSHVSLCYPWAEIIRHLPAWNVLQALRAGGFRKMVPWPSNKGHGLRLSHQCTLRDWNLCKEPLKAPTHRMYVNICFNWSWQYKFCKQMQLNALCCKWQHITHSVLYHVYVYE